MGWEFHQLTGIDSYVGEFVGDSIVLRFDFGGYSNPLKEEKKTAYVVVQKAKTSRKEAGPKAVVQAKNPGQLPGGRVAHA
jgi:hypothetical protein